MKVFILPVVEAAQFIVIKIAGICSDNGRLDNCQNFLIRDNIFFSYNGDSFGAYKHGENSLANR